MSIPQLEPTNVTLIVHTMPHDLPAERARQYFDAYRVHFLLADSPAIREYAAAVLRELVELDRSRRQEAAAQ